MKKKRLLEKEQAIEKQQLKMYEMEDEVRHLKRRLYLQGKEAEEAGRNAKRAQKEMECMRRT